MAHTTIEGTVESVNGTGSGFRVKETLPGREGRTYSRYWSCWFPRASTTAIPSKGDTVRAAGTLSTKVSEPERRYVDHTLNDVVVEIAPRPTPVADVPPPDDYPPYDSGAWSVAPIPSDDTPF